MAEPGIRALRILLSQYLDRVRTEEELVVTDRGTAVTRIVQVDQPRTADPSSKGPDRGRARPGAAAPPTTVPDCRAVSDLVDDCDGDRLLRHLSADPAARRGTRIGHRRAAGAQADRVASLLLVCAEARAAGAQAERLGRLTRHRVRRRRRDRAHVPARP